MLISEVFFNMFVVNGTKLACSLSAPVVLIRRKCLRGALALWWAFNLTFKYQKNA